MKVFFTREIAKVGMDMIRQAGHEITIWSKEDIPTPEELISICKKHDALVVADRNKINAEFLEACSNLKVVALHSVGYNHVDLAAAKKIGVRVGNTPFAGSKETADTAFLLMIAVSKKAFYMHKTIQQGLWKGFDPTGNIGFNLRRKTLGVFGLGDIGFEMARLSKAAYGMTIIYHNRSHNEKAERELQAKRVSFEELLEQSDVLSIHSPLTKDTYNTFGAEAFHKMKQSAVLINTARGGIVNEQALIEALETNQIWGAGLDVTHPEPMLPDNPLLTMPNVAITPHIGNAVDTARNKVAKMVAENVIAGLKEETLPHEIRFKNQ